MTQPATAPLPALVILALIAAPGSSDAWRYTEYDKPEGWAGMCIDGKRQSPIDLVTETAEPFVVEPLEFFNFRHLNGSLTNNGHSIAIHFDEDNCDSGVTGGMLRAMYILHEMHFHWDSEHTINGKRFPLELHLVHFNSKYGDMRHATHQHDGLAVVAILFEESENGTDILDPFLESVRGVSSTVQAKANLPPYFNPIDFMPSDRSKFFRYSGSLTTPPCLEIVTWTLMETKMPVSIDQMKVFRQVTADSGILQYNYRRLQEINERQVYLLTDNHAVPITSTMALIIACIISSFL